MIYNESTKSFIKLETALKELGFDQQTIDLALEYLDITKPRNNDLMRKIITRYYPKLMQYSYREKAYQSCKVRYQIQIVRSLKTVILFSVQWQRSIFPIYDRSAVWQCLYIFRKQSHVYEAAH